MAIMDADRFEHDVMKLWTLVVDLSDQLSQTKQVASTLRNETIKLKVRRPVVVLLCTDVLYQAQALHSETGFVFRRYISHA